MSDRPPNVRHFAALAATVRHGSLTQAARAVNLTQPALSQAIGALETSLEVTLFKRGAAGMIPTEPALRLAALPGRQGAFALLAISMSDDGCPVRRTRERSRQLRNRRATRGGAAVLPLTPERKWCDGRISGTCAMAQGAGRFAKSRRQTHQAGHDGRNAMHIAPLATAALLALSVSAAAIAQTPNPPPLPPGPGAVSFQGVTLRYDGAEPALSGVSLDVPAGRTIALVGPTGSGKTSLVALIARLYDPTDGRVLLDGADLRSVDVASLRNSVAFVADESFLFSATVAENVTSCPA